MEEYDTRRSTAVIISHEHTDIVYLSAEQILKSDPVVFDRQTVFNSICKHERYCQISDLCWAKDWMFLPYSPDSIWYKYHVCLIKCRSNWWQNCCWLDLLQRLWQKINNSFLLVRVSDWQRIAFVMNKYLMLFITYMMFNIQQCEVCHFCTTSGTKCNLKNNLFWRKYN